MNVSDESDDQSVTPQPASRTGEFRYGARTPSEWVPEVVRRLAARFDPIKIILFGSQARGTPGRDSDIDLVVVLPHVEDGHATAIALRREIADLPPPVDIFPTDPEEFARRSRLPGSILRAALREGRVVYERAG